uniref:Transmembrane protein n=1 Tax=Meloidogyne hapla TaxID=6305 RepID=A0A1I8B3A8_MELHA
MPEILNIPVAESKNSRYKPSHLTRVASIVICFLLVALVSTFTVEVSNKYCFQKQSSLQQHQQLLEQHPRMWSRPVMRLVPQGQMESQLHSFEKEKRMVSWQPVKREDLLLWTEEEIGERKIYDAIARERGEFACEFKKLEADQQLSAALRAGKRLGISPEAILEHLRIQNGGG